MKRKTFFYLLFAFCLVIPGIANAQGMVANIADQVLTELRKNLTRPLHRSEPILSTSFVNLNDFNQGSPLGVMLGDYVSGGLTKFGYKVKEIRLDQTNMIIEPKTGEYVLTRNVSKLDSSPQCKVLLVGTYTISPDQRIYLTARLIDSEDGTILSSALISARANQAIRDLAGLGIAVRSEKNEEKIVEKQETAEVVESAEKLKAMEVAEEKMKEEVASVMSSEPLQGPYESGQIFLSLNVPDDICRVQGRLKDLGLYTYHVDGIWGKRSQHALQVFKRISRLPDPKVWDLETQKKLFKY